jgi:putative aminopeptidase FrvX
MTGRGGMTVFNLVKTLTELDGPTGYEDPVQDWLTARWTELGLAVQRTPIGNLLARVGGEGPRLLIGAHADEISFRVKSIDDRGFLWLTAGRGRAEERLPEPVPLGYPARILLDSVEGTGVVEGVFATVTGHVMTRQQRAEYERRAYDWLDFYVDVGVRSRSEAEALGLRPGLPVINAVATRRVGRHIVGKAMDDRAGLAIMTALAERVDRRQLRYDVWFTSMVMEEIGMIGARSVARGFNLGIIVEVGLAGDVPLVDPRTMPVALGRGPVLVHKDLAMPYDRRVTAALARAAAAAEIPIQHATFQNFSSDGAEWVQEGLPTAMVAFPCRYTHSPFETVDEEDLRRTVEWLEAFLTAS